jgi:hypothetical protein
VTGGTLAFSGAGEVVVQATQAGNANWLAADAVMRTVTVSKASATVMLAQLERTYDAMLRRASDGGAQFTWMGYTGLVYRIFVSTNLTDWTLEREIRPLADQPIVIEDIGDGLEGGYLRLNVRRDDQLAEPDRPF